MGSIRYFGLCVQGVMKGDRVNRYDALEVEEFAGETYVRGKVSL